jgi:signal transduction histidine kinase
MVKTRLPAHGPRDTERLRDLKLTCMNNLLAAEHGRVYFKDRLSRFLFVSAGWISAYTPGRAPEDLVGKTDFDVFSDQHASAAFGDEQQIIRTGEPLVGKVERETYGRQADAYVWSTKMPLRDDRGRIIGTFGISRDITPQVTAENAVAQQALELSAQNERLRELDRLKDEFIGMISHELRTPLASIIGYVELLKDEHTSEVSTGHFAAAIDRNAQRLLHLVADLLFLSGIESGKIAVELHQGHLADIVAAAVAAMRAEAQRKHIDLVFSAATVPHSVFDPARVAQLVGNLVSNAVKFTPDGGKVDVRLAADGDQAVLTVSDSGTGIPAADRERIFERFYRTATATQQAVPGTGLGLTISQAIVHAHDGTITVDSSEGHGSTFTIRLPLRPGPETGTESGPEAGAGTGPEAGAGDS